MPPPPQMSPYWLECGQNRLHLTSRLEAAHLPFFLPHRLARVLGAVGEPLVLAVLHPGMISRLAAP